MKGVEPGNLRSESCLIPTLGNSIDEGRIKTLAEIFGARPVPRPSGFFQPQRQTPTQPPVFKFRR